MNTAPASHTTSVSVTSQITQLPDLSMSDIKSIWKELFHADTPTPTNHLPPTPRTT